MRATRIGGVVRRTGRGLAIGAAITGVATVSLIAGQALIASLRRYLHPVLGPHMRASLGSTGRPVVRLVVVGDSSAAGAGVDDVAETVGGQLAAQLAAVGKRVELSSVAVTGSRCADLGPQVARALLGQLPDVAVILVGANDALRGPLVARSAIDLGDAVGQLRSAGVAVVVGTCPDLGAVRAIAPPLRTITGWLSRRVAAAHHMAVRQAGGVPVDLGRRTGAVFRADPGMLSEDRFHPSADGYRIWAHALYPAVYDAARSVPSR